MKTAGRRGFSSHYVNLGGTERKLRRLLRDFRFAPMRDCLAPRVMAARLLAARRRDRLRLRRLSGCCSSLCSRLRPRPVRRAPITPDGRSCDRRLQRGGSDRRQARQLARARLPARPARHPGRVRRLDRPHQRDRALGATAIACGCCALEAASARPSARTTPPRSPRARSWSSPTPPPCTSRTPSGRWSRTTPTPTSAASAATSLRPRGRGRDGKGRQLYWNYEASIRRWESQIHTVIGATGCIYSLRKSLYTPLDSGRDQRLRAAREGALQKGYRSVVEDDAVCYEVAESKQHRRRAPPARACHRARPARRRLHAGGLEPAPAPVVLPSS